MTDSTSENARQSALDYHALPKPGKLEIRATKPMANQRDLSRAYSPGVAEACLEIKADPANAALYSQFGNLDTNSGRRMRGALAILDAQDLRLRLRGRDALGRGARSRTARADFPQRALRRPANVLTFANTDAASAVLNVAKALLRSG